MAFSMSPYFKGATNALRNFYQGTPEVEVLADSAYTHPYNSRIVVPKMESNIKPNGSQQQMPAQTHARFLFGNAANYQPFEQNCYERPLVMDAWAQTSMEDFNIINDEHRVHIENLQKENETLREKIRLLETDLRVHSDLLNQIHATAALKTKPTHENLDHISPTPPATPIMNHAQQYQNMQRISPNTATTYTTTTHTQVMNSLQTSSGTCVATSDSVKYTIVSNSLERNENAEPIEIQLAEEDGALNLNSSADSGRLEICLNDQEMNQTQEEEIKFKPKNFNEQNVLPPLPAQSGILIKRRKLSSPQAGDGLTDYDTDTSAHIEMHSTKRNTNTPIQNSHHLTTSNLTENQTLRHLHDDNVMVSIGPNNTRVPYKLYESINWDNPSIATRKLLMSIFDRQTLATHSMTGKPSPAFKGQAKPQKQRLDPKVTEDIIFVVTRRCKVSDKEVRNAITTKCADENKMMKLQINKKNSQQKNKENHHYINVQQQHHL